MKPELYKDKKEIEHWLSTHDIKNYQLIVDSEYGYTVNAQSDINISNRSLSAIRVKFNNVRGSFFCNNNHLSSLLGAPEIIEGEFVCCDNRLTNLLHSPKKVNSHYYIYCNQLVSLKGCPRYVGGVFHVSDNQLTNLLWEEFPDFVKGSVILKNNPLPQEFLFHTDFDTIADILKIHTEKIRMSSSLPNTQQAKINKI